MHPAEAFIVNRYAASELAGALMLGQESRKTGDPYLMRMLAWHCAEEARHSAVWYDLIEDLGISTGEVHDDSGDDYFSLYSEIDSMIAFLAFVHVYEHRVPFHFAAHAAWTENEKLKAVLLQLVAEEGSHLSWVRRWLLEQDREIVDRELARFRSKEAQIYSQELERMKQDPVLAGFAREIESRTFHPLKL